MVTRTGFEPMLPAGEAGVLGHLTNGPHKVHRSGILKAPNRLIINGAPSDEALSKTFRWTVL